MSQQQRQRRQEQSRRLYDILQVEPTATEDEIRRAYRRLALRYHPDKNPGDQAASAERFKAVQRAYRVLGNPYRRQIYDIYESESLAERLPDNQLWVLASGRGLCLLLTTFLATCCCCCCFFCCYCCCYFCCGLCGPVREQQDVDLDSVVRTQPAGNSTSRELTEYSSLLGTHRCGMSQQQRQRQRQRQQEQSRRLYDILQVAPTATEEEIRRAYRRLALRYHPDKNPGDQVASAERFKAVQRAYRVLGDPYRREVYDLYGSESLAESLPDNQLWVLTSGWGMCMLLTTFLVTCCCCGCFFCCYCCCYFCCGLCRPVHVQQQDVDLDIVVTSQPAGNSTSQELTEYSSLLGAHRFLYSSQPPRRE